VDSNTCYNLPSDRKHPRQYVFEVLIGGEAVCCMCAEDDAQTKLWISSLRDAIRGENIKPVAATPVDDGVSTVSAATKSTKVDSTFQRGLPSPVKSKVTKDVKGPYWYVGLSCLKNTNAKVLGSFGAAGSSTGLRRRRDVRFSIDYGWERNVIRDATAANEAEKQRQIKIKERAEARKKEIAKAAAAAKERREKEEEERRKKEEERRKKEEERARTATKTADNLDPNAAFAATKTPAPSMGASPDVAIAAKSAAERLRKVRQLRSVLNLDSETCRTLLSLSDWDMNKALDRYGSGTFDATATATTTTPISVSNDGFAGTGLGIASGSDSVPGPNALPVATGFGGPANPNPTPVFPVVTPNIPVASVVTPAPAPPRPGFWFFKENDGSWRPYGRQDNAALESSFLSMAALCDFSNKYGKYRVTFDRATQKHRQVNMTTGGQREVARTMDRSSAAAATTTTTTTTSSMPASQSGWWEFQDNDGSWKSYTKEDAAMLERAFRARQASCSLQNKWGQYRVSIGSSGMRQVNVRTHVSRAVRRRRPTSGADSHSSPYTSVQRGKINHLKSLLGASEGQCATLLSKNDWDISKAVNAYYDSGGGGGGVFGAMHM